MMVMWSLVNIKTSHFILRLRQPALRAGVPKYLYSPMQIFVFPDTNITKYLHSPKVLIFSFPKKYFYFWREMQIFPNIWIPQIHIFRNICIWGIQKIGVYKVGGRCRTEGLPAILLGHKTFKTSRGWRGHRTCKTSPGKLLKSIEQKQSS